MAGGGGADRARQACRRETVDRRAGRELARIAADHLPIGRRRRLVIGFRGEHLRAAGGQPRFRLRHVGARHLADIEAVAGLPQLLLQHLDVAPLQVEDRAVAQQIHVGGRRVEQHGLLGRRARSRARPAPALSAWRVLLAVWKPLNSVCVTVAPAPTRRVVAALAWNRSAGAPGDGGAATCRGRGQRLLAAGRGDGDLRPIAGQRLRHAFVGGAHGGALRIERRVVLIGLRPAPNSSVSPRTSDAVSGNAAQAATPAASPPTHRLRPRRDIPTQPLRDRRKAPFTPKR